MDTEEKTLNDLMWELQNAMSRAYDSLAVYATSGDDKEPSLWAEIKACIKGNL